MRLSRSSLTASSRHEDCLVVISVCVSNDFVCSFPETYHSLYMTSMYSSAMAYRSSCGGCSVCPRFLAAESR